jgi:hypothetical protein
MKLNVFAVVALLAAGAIATGCGSSDGNSDSTTTASLTKAEWIAKADAICKQGNQEINQATKQFQGKPTQAQFDQFATDTLAPSVQKQVDQIRALSAPGGNEAQVNAILDAAEADVNKVKANPSSIQGDPFADANKLARAYGLKVCGQ